MRRKPVNESEYYATEMTDAELDAQADAGEFYLDEQGFYLLPSPEDVQTMMEEGQQMLNDALWRQMNEEI
jgi:hypothetical protein